VMIPNRIRSGLLGAGAAAGPLFVGAFIVLGSRKAGYDARRHPISSLALGQGGWLQRANFVTTGLLYLGGAAGLARRPRGVAGSGAAAALIAAAGAGLVGSGVFVTDPVGGFPPGLPTPDQPSRTGMLHGLSALPIFLGIPALALLSALRFAKRHDRGWAWYSGASGALMAITFALFGAAFGQAPRLAPWGGLIQRTCVATGFGWLTALFFLARQNLLRQPPIGS
jgi:hypothetical protein